MSVLLELKDVCTYTHDGQRLSPPLGLKLAAGDLILVEGENGSGKTTLVRSILGLHRKYSGEIINTVSAEDTAYLPQTAGLQFFLPLSVQDVIQLRAPASEEDILALGLLDRTSLERPWNTASGGERQKALLAGVLLAKPKLVVLDEPFNHLDTEARNRALARIKDLLRTDAGVMLISHSSVEGLEAKQRLLLSRQVPA